MILGSRCSFPYKVSYTLSKLFLCNMWKGCQIHDFNNSKHFSWNFIQLFVKVSIYYFAYLFLSSIIISLNCLWFGFILRWKMSESNRGSWRLLLIFSLYFYNQKAKWLYRKCFSPPTKLERFLATRSLKFFQC